MPRMVLHPLDAYPFETEIKVRITDINNGGHLGNDRLLSLIHEARFAFLAEHEFTELDCGGVSLTMTDAIINYQSQAFAGDVLTFKVAAGEPFRCGFRLYYRVIRSTDNQVIATVETGMACLDYTTGKLQILPEGVNRMFGSVVS